MVFNYATTILPLCATLEALDGVYRSHSIVYVRNYLSGDVMICLEFPGNETSVTELCFGTSDELLVVGHQGGLASVYCITTRQD
jgi:hypothetical protein